MTRGPSTSLWFSTYSTRASAFSSRCRRRTLSEVLDIERIFTQTKVMRPASRREVADHLQVAYDVSERRTYQATGFGRSSQCYRKRSDPQVALRMRLEELAAARVRYGYRRLHILLQRQGWAVNHKCTYRIYRDEGLSIEPKLPKCKRTWRYQQRRPAIGDPTRSGPWTSCLIACSMGVHSGS